MDKVKNNVTVEVNILIIERRKEVEAEKLEEIKVDLVPTVV